MVGIVLYKYQRDFYRKLKAITEWWKSRKVPLLKLKGISLKKCNVFDKKEISFNQKGRRSIVRLRSVTPPIHTPNPGFP